MPLTAGLVPRIVGVAASGDSGKGPGDSVFTSGGFFVKDLRLIVESSVCRSKGEYDISVPVSYLMDLTV